MYRFHAEFMQVEVGCSSPDLPKTPVCLDTNSPSVDTLTVRHACNLSNRVLSVHVGICGACMRSKHHKTIITLQMHIKTADALTPRCIYQ